VTGHVLVMAKAPVAGRVKTRLGRVVGHEVAVDLARRALLDTLGICAAAFGPRRCLLALDGSLGEDPDNAVVARALDSWIVFPQRGGSFATRLVAAHHEAACAIGVDLGDGLVQIGMDTPQVTADQLLGLVAGSAPRQVALGPASDGGWWGLAHRDPACVAGLGEVAMSTPDTCRLTRAAIEASGYRVMLGPTLRDVDTMDDAYAVGAEAPATRFADGVRRLPEAAG
jgi:hypothetical protein